MAAWSDTIVALSSGVGRAGVAVIRLSGPQVRFVLETVFGQVPPERRAVLGGVSDASGDLIDRGIALFFPGPRSFTGEDVAEFQVHGSPAVVRALIERLCALPGLRPADAGEFTRRAFENGRLDLAEVEGLADLIDSETEWQRRQALGQMEGALSAAVDQWRDGLLAAMVRLEAEIDFSDEGDVDGPLVREALELIAPVSTSLRDALGGFSRGERVREGFVVVLSGAPNAGKSTLLNRLARRDVAIVSAIPGTTRDALEVRMDIDGAPVILIDTAGLREAGDAIEAEGVRRARALADRADLVLRLRAPGEPAGSIDGDMRTIVVASKADLAGPHVHGELPVSAETGEGIPALLDLIRNRIEPGGGEPALLTRERHRLAVMQALAALDRALALGAEGQAELIAEDLRIAVRALERLIGKVDAEAVLDRLFAGFCIGK